MKTVPQTGLRRGLTDLFSLPPLPFEWLAAWILLHYGALFRGSEKLTGPFQSAVAAMMPHQFWGILAMIVGSIMIVLTLCNLWLQKSLQRPRQIACVAGMLLMGFLAYACWKGDVPFDVSRVFYYYAAIHAFAGVLLLLRIRADAADDDDEIPGVGGTA